MIKYILHKVNKNISRWANLALVFFVAFSFFIPLNVEARSETYGGVTYYEGTMIGPIGQEVDSTGWSAAHVIYQASQWYGINPQVLLATLQKESSLVTNSNPPFYLPMWAMGYAYTDSGIRDVCRTDTNNNPTGSCAGFPMQMDWAAGTLKYHQSHFANNATTVYDYQSGSNTTITPSNGGTYSLYKYTPYITRPNTFCNIFNNTFGWSTGQDCNNPLNVINDSVFTNKDAMSEADIQAFLASRGSFLASYTVPADNIKNVYRFYRIGQGTHFYTSSEAEKRDVMSRLSSMYRLEGVAYSINTNNLANSAPLYRFYNKKNGTHFYTSSETEKNSVISKLSATYGYEGIAYNVSKSGGLPVYRFYKIGQSSHFYTSSEAEKNVVLARMAKTYRLEGIAFYLAP